MCTDVTDDYGSSISSVWYKKGWHKKVRVLFNFSARVLFINTFLVNLQLHTEFHSLQSSSPAGASYDQLEPNHCSLTNQLLISRVTNQGNHAGSVYLLGAAAAALSCCALTKF